MDLPYQERLIAAALTGERFSASDGAYVRWAPGAGVELWLEVQAGEVISLAPHFSGEAVMPVALTERIPRPEESPLAAGLRAWANPPDDAFDEGDYPFVFDVPDAARFSALALPCTTTVQLAAFAHELHCYSDEAAFDQFQGNAELKYASESFIPLGLFVEEGQAPSAYATFTGRVVHAATRINPFSGGAFWALLVQTLGGEVDMVADPAAVKGEPEADGIVQGSFWLSGRLPEALVSRRRRFWQR